ncbi:MAG: ABC transporter permease [candidate division Zixibacteria bacterium]|nr:ABC transporter permease [candidate division Zixibacteria bacterium]
MKYAVRNLLKNRRLTLINILGLAVGTASVLLILVYVIGESSYENFHARRGRICRVAVDYGLSGSKMGFAGVMPALGPAAAAEIPEVENAVRWRRDYRARLERGSQSFVEQNLFFVDSSVFDIFSFNLLSGTRDILKEPFAVVISKSMAEKYFDGEDPLGQTLVYDGEFYLKIAGVMEDVPANTHLNCDFLVSYASLVSMGQADEGVWNSCGKDFTYLLLRENADRSLLLKKLDGLLAANANEEMVRVVDFKLQPLTQIHFNTDCFVDWGRKGNITYVYVFSTVAFLILLIAGFNFVNLSTAHFDYRRREVSVKKVLGAGRLHMIKQFLAESLLTSLTAVVAALALYEVLFPQLSAFLGSNVLVNRLSLSSMILIVLVLGVANGLLAGFYPALSLSGFKPLMTNLKSATGGSGRSVLRKVLVIAQFAVTVILIIGTAVIFRQLAFMQNERLGFDKDNVIIMSISPSNQEGRDNYAELKEMFKQYPGIISASGAYTVPGVRSKETWTVRKEEDSPENNLNVRTTAVDVGYVATLGLELVEGRDFSENNPLDIRQGILINEAAAEQLGLGNPVGKKIFGLTTEGQPKTDIIGVVRNFHVTSFREKIEPFVMYINPARSYVMAVRLHPDKKREALAYIEKCWSSVYPDKSFDYTYLEDIYNSLYVSETKMGQLLGMFTLLAVFVASLGLFGLVTFMVEKRRKEIGIRKVMGASVSGIVLLLAKDFSAWILFANLIAWPVAYFASVSWLENYFYRINPDWTIFFAALLLVMILALLTVSFNSLKAALSNPITALRDE